ncbi:hypothetical protein LIA77_07364 [Sarocladium implicatum]|nr:hypothetical protein LIA77_07364 [Sarocladium implicatum]
MASFNLGPVPGSLPLHVTNPDSWTREAEMDLSLSSSSSSSEYEPLRPEQEPSIPAATHPVSQEAVSMGARRAMQQANADEAADAREAERLMEAAAAEFAKQPRFATTRRSASSNQMVQSGASFNSPWVIQRKVESRVEPDEDIERSRVFELYKLHAVQYEVNKGDTLVIVDYPPPPTQASLRLDCFGTAYGSQQFRVHSEKLLATGSSVFKDMLGPTRQFRTLRRRKLVNKLPEDVKYVLDLTPPQEGDDLVMAMTELSLTPGIIKWWMADKFHGVDSCLVNGHDDICTCMREKHGTAEDKDKGRETDQTPDLASRKPSKPFDASHTKSIAADGTDSPTVYSVRFKDPPKPATLAALKETGLPLDHDIPHYRKIPDYCPFRHCNSIIRLLMFIEGHNIIVDSASRMWTLLGIAKILDCQLILRDKITQWLMYGVNTRFIEVLPEESLKIGFALQLPDVTQAAFRILVNELALELAATTDAKASKESGVTVFGRKKGDAGDELNNIIQHAARAFCERVEARMKVLEDGRVGENLEIGEWQRLCELEACLSASDHPIAQKTVIKVRQIMLLLDRDFKVSLNRISRGSHPHHAAAYQSIDQDRATYIEPADWQPIENVMLQLNEMQRRLCAFFYHDLMYLCQGLLAAQGRTPSQRGQGEVIGDLCSEVQTELEALDAEMLELLPDEISAPHPVSCQRFTPILLHMFRNQLDTAIMPTAYWWHRHSIEPPLNLTRHLLLTLVPNELKYLPLWAGGNDDGTGGVFESALPSAELGPNGPGPAYHTGATIPSTASSVSGSLMEEIRNMNVKGSTTAGSIDVHDSISTVYRPDKVIADDKSIATESFGTSEGGAYAEARYFEPADHQLEGRTLDMLVEGSTSGEGSVADGSVSGKPVKDLTAEDWEVDDGSDSGSDTLSDSSMIVAYKEERARTTRIESWKRIQAAQMSHCSLLARWRVDKI